MTLASVRIFMYDGDVHKSYVYVRSYFRGQHLPQSVLYFHTSGWYFLVHWLTIFPQNVSLVKLSSPISLPISLLVSL